MSWLLSGLTTLLLPLIALVASLALIGAATWALAAIYLDQQGRGPVLARAVDLIIVPGALVRPDGTASPALRARVERAVALYASGHAATLLITGGPGAHPSTEAEVGAAIARALGVPDTALLLETAATRTAENASLSAKLADQALGRPAGSLRVLVVTHHFHVVRCRRLFQRHFGEVYVTGVPMARSHRWRAAGREVLALLVHQAR